MRFQEHNNREIANQYAEHITGEALRKYVADKVKKYVGDNIVVFDGAVGSGQLEQFINLTKLYGVDVQQKAIETARLNFENTDLEVKSFFNYHKNIVADVVVMNPPFSLKLKDLSQEEQTQILLEFNWKKSGVVDDIFVLRSLNYTKRYGFYILFPGVGYRKTEEHFRWEIGTKLAELNKITNAFESTAIDVLFIVIDKEKKSNEVYKEIFNAKEDKVLHSKTEPLEEDFSWRPLTIEQEEEKIDIEAVQTELTGAIISHLEKSLEWQFGLVEIFRANINLKELLDNLEAVLKKYKDRLMRI